MVGLESNKAKIEGENAIFGKNSLVLENKSIVISQASGHCSNCYQWPGTAEEGSWSDEEAVAAFTGAVQRSSDVRRAMVLPGDGRRR